MKIYPEELILWDKEKQKYLPPRLTISQKKLLQNKINTLLAQTKKFYWIHNLFNTGLIFILIFLNFSVFMFLNKLNWPLIAIMHGFLTYSLTIFTLHEGAGHKRIILNPNNNFFLRFLSSLLNNVSRLYFANPSYYVSRHPLHHKYLGTQHDGAFTQLVAPKRIFFAFLPMASYLPFSDYKIHQSNEWSNSKCLSIIIGLGFHLILFLIARNQSNNILLILIFLFISPWIAFCLDRLRETTEHLFCENGDLPAAREMGNNFWGYLIGGGPWGQPCHLSHHLAPSLAWYQQLRLSFFLKSILNLEQTSYYFIPTFPNIFPIFFKTLMQKNLHAFKTLKTINQFDSSL